MEDEAYKVFGLQEKTLITCSDCNMKFRSLRSAYEHFRHKHKGTKKGPLNNKDKCEIINCIDNNLSYDIHPRDGIVCGYCFKGTNSGHFMSIVGCVSHQKNSCPHKTNEVFRNEMRLKWRTKNALKRTLTGTETKTLTGSETEGVPETKTGAGAETKTLTVTEAVRVTEIETDTEAVTVTDTETETETEALTGTGTGTDNSTILPEKKSDVAVKPAVRRSSKRIEEKTLTETKTPTGSETEGVPETKTGAETKTDTETEKKIDMAIKPAVRRSSARNKHKKKSDSTIKPKKERLQQSVRRCSTRIKQMTDNSTIKTKKKRGMMFKDEFGVDTLEV